MSVVHAILDICWLAQLELPTGLRTEIRFVIG